MSSTQRYGPMLFVEDPGQVKLSAATAVRTPAYQAAFNWKQRQGHTRIGLCLSRPYAQSATSKLTINSYVDVLCHRPEQSCVVYQMRLFQDGYRAGKMLSAKQPVFICGNGVDILAGCRQYLLYQHLPIPPLMGQENQLSSRHLNKCTMYHHVTAMCAAALKLACRAEVSQTVIQSDLILRVVFCSILTKI